MLTLALAGCRGPVTPANPTPATASIKLLAETSTAPLLRELADAYRPERTLVAWQIQDGEWENVSIWLRAGRAPYALTNAPLPHLAGQDEWWSTPIGQDGLALVVNGGNAIASLSPAQLRGIFTGRVLNWREVGGADLTVQIVARPPGSAEDAILRTLIMGERKLSGSAQLATSPARVIDLVSAGAGAVGLVSMRYLGADGVRPVAVESVLPTPATVAANQYPLRSPLLFVGARAPDADDPYRAFFAWVQSPPGQAIVARYYGALNADR